jgi:hypothetical protein
MGGGGRGGGYPPRDLIIHGNLLFASNNQSSNVSVFSINPGTGALTLVPGSPFATLGGHGDDGLPLAISHNGKFLFASNTGSGTITVFNILGNGALSRVTGSPFLVGSPISLTITPDNQFVIGGTGNSLTVLRISSSGALSLVPGSPFFSNTGRGFSGTEIRCDGKIFVAGAAGVYTTVHVFTLTEAGLPVPVPGSPFMATSGLNTNVIRLSPNLQFLFTSNQFSNSVTTFRVALDGSLTPIFGDWFNVRLQTPENMVTDSKGNFLYVASYPCSVEGFHINSDGSLSQLAEFPICLPDGYGIHALASYPAMDCDPVNGMTFDICIQDESTNNVLRLNTTTGAYLFTKCINGYSEGGMGTISKRGCTTTFNDFRNDRRITASIDTCSNRATASVQIFTQGSTFSLIDRNITNNNCSCPNSN